MRRGPHWDDIVVQVVTFLGAFVCLYQRSADKHQTLGEMLKSGVLIGACVSAFVAVGVLEMRGAGVSAESHRSGKRRNLWRRCIMAFALGYSAPGLGSAMGGSS